MKALLLTCLVCFANTVFAQVEMLATEITDIKQIKLKTYEITVKDFPQNTIESLKEELTNWESKITEVIYDSINAKLFITHTNQFNDIEFIEVLGKYAMSKKQVLSYN